jgi:hypothetical protein
MAERILYGAHVLAAFSSGSNPVDLERRQARISKFTIDTRGERFNRVGKPVHLAVG